MKRPVVLVVCGVLFCLGVVPARAAEEARKLTPEKALSRKVDRHAAKGSFRAVLVDLASRAGVTFQVDWKALAKTGVTEETPAAVEVEKATWRQTLEVLLARVSRRGHPLGWRTEAGDIIISTHKRILEMEFGARVAASKLASRGSARKAKVSQVTVPRRPVPEIKFNKLPFRDALGFFKTLTKANFHVNWRAMEQEGISPDTPVTLDLRGVSVGRAMDLMLTQVNADHDKLTSAYWVIHGGVVMISTGNALNKELITRVIDAGNLLLVQPDSAGPRMEMSSASDAASLTDSTGGSQDIWPDETERESRSGKNESYAELKKKHAEKVIETIKSMIGAEMWGPEGKGSIRILNNKLVISQTLLGFKLLEKALR